MPTLVCISTSTAPTRHSPCAAGLGVLIRARVSHVVVDYPMHGHSHAPTGTYAYDKLNPDLFAPPGTDRGNTPNAKWPMGLSHNRQGSQPGAGWARNQNVGQLPAAKAMAGVDMRLAPHAYREYVSASQIMDIRGITGSN